MRGVSSVAPHRALIVDYDPHVSAEVAGIVESAGYFVVRHSEFEHARRELREHPPALLIANMRLGAFNGIHLAHLARFAKPDVRVVIYADPHDPTLAREAQAAGAFYERGGFIAISLPALLRTNLPDQDRRGSITIDRRTTFRGGRRTTDAAALHAGAAP